MHYMQRGMIVRPSFRRRGFPRATAPPRGGHREPFAQVERFRCKKNSLVFFVTLHSKTLWPKALAEHRPGATAARKSRALQRRPGRTKKHPGWFIETSAVVPWWIGNGRWNHSYGRLVLRRCSTRRSGMVLKTIGNGSWERPGRSLRPLESWESIDGG
jgi:hypothetical protein